MQTLAQFLAGMAKDPDATWMDAWGNMQSVDDLDEYADHWICGMIDADLNLPRFLFQDDDERSLYNNGYDAATGDLIPRALACGVDLHRYCFNPKAEQLLIAAGFIRRAWHFVDGFLVRRE